MPLPPPSAANDDTYLAALCQNQTWAAPHQAEWLAAYVQYRNNGGNPWAVSPVTFTPNVSADQYDLYDKRKGTNRIKNIRQMPGLLCCPMCGSETTGSLDHFLPRITFPEFSIMTANLVPACAHCNSASKGNTFRGTSPESFIHPYFENLAAAPLWQIEISTPFPAATFRPMPVGALSPAETARVAFHLRHVLGTQFNLWASNKWARLPQVIRNAIGGMGGVTTAEVQAEFVNQLAQANASTGINSWLSAFYRGLRNNSAAQTFIASEVSPLTPTAAA